MDRAEFVTIAVSAIIIAACCVIIYKFLEPHL
jgi:hypothetical protein